MRSERITILVTPEQKQQLTALARRQHVSVGKLVRSAASRTSGDAPAEPVPTAEQIHALEKAADTATAALRRAGTALDRAEAESAKTRESFGSKADQVREPGETPQSMLYRAIARTQARLR